LERTACIYFWLVRFATLIVNFNNSPRIRSAPHNGLRSVTRHALDQGNHVRTQALRLGLRLLARFQLPEQSKALSVPAQQGVLLDDLQDLFPIGNPTRKEYQRQAFPPRQPGRLCAAAKDNQLVPQ
jgi:hypothetical protein